MVVCLDVLNHWPVISCCERDVYKQNLFLFYHTPCTIHSKKALFRLWTFCLVLNLARIYHSFHASIDHIILPHIITQTLTCIVYYFIFQYISFRQCVYLKQHVLSNRDPYESSGINDTTDLKQISARTFWDWFWGLKLLKMFKHY